ncbi:hypothetical protein OH77DRAFT_1496072 [Trametes cingulata]|nr:hypothetical protein OH77DRAFT_1496072 [Trametes cingulata]
MEKRKRGKKTVKVGADGVARRAMWYEEWAEGEELRRTSTVIDPSIPRIERLHQAAYEFKHGRPLHSNQELSQLWDRFRLYIGLISGMQPPASRKKNAQMRDALAAMAEPPADDEDDEEEDEMPNARPPKEANVVVANDEGAPRAVPPSQPKPGVTEEQRQQRREYYREVRDTKMDRFLNDPETAVKIFLSGYFRDRGMSFSEKFCRDGPYLVAFFLNFLLRNRVFPESEKDLRKAVAVTEQAKKELLHSFVISRAIPDDFSRGCEILFGTMTTANIWQNVAPADEEGEKDEDERDAKRQKVDGTQAEAAVLQQAAGTDEIEIVTPDTMMAMEQDAVADANLNGQQDASDSSEAGAAAWGSASADSGAGNSWGWGQADAAAVPDRTWGEANAEWGAPEDHSMWDATPKSNPLNELFGPTALPLTHTTGVIERSTRRVKAIIPPSPQKNQKGKKSKSGAATSGPDPEAVERDLEARLTQVVLIPWHEWDVYDKADVTKPQILADSRGPVVRDENEPAPAPSADGTPAPVPHNPFKNEITLLVEPSAAEKLLIGVGLEATWIQLARADPSVPMVVDEESIRNPYVRRNKKHVGAPGEPAAPTRYWYMESMLSVFPSFHTEMVPLPTTEDVFGPEAAQ